MYGKHAPTDRSGGRIPFGPRPDDGPPARALVVTCLHGCLPAGALERQLETAGLIVARTAANLVPPFGAGDPFEEVIERAVSEGRVRDVIICGHAGCATLARLFDARLALEDFALAAWLEHAEAVRRAAFELPPAERLRRAAELNVRQQLVHAGSHPAVAAATSAGRLRLLGWLLDPARGEVLAADHAGRFTRRAALDPAQNHLFRKERLRAEAPPLPPRDLGSRFLA